MYNILSPMHSVVIFMIIFMSYFVNVFLISLSELVETQFYIEACLYSISSKVYIFSPIRQ